MYSVYLAGPIKGLSFTESSDWRHDVKQALAPEITCFSPMRGKHYLMYEDYIKDTYEQHPLSTAQAITARDKFDVMRCDMLFVNLLGAKAVSIGTMLELGWASMLQKPILVVMEDDNIHSHGMVKSIVGWKCNGLDEAVSLTKAILLP